MEWFKVSAGSWSYPEAGVFVAFGVPLFSGFICASVGSYIARVIRVFDMAVAPYPPFWLTLILAGAIYVNHFAHHFLPDVRLGLFLATAILYAGTKVWFRSHDRHWWMPLALAALLAALALWVAENLGTATGTWVYSGQSPGRIVSLARLGCWYLLLYTTFVTVTLVSRSALSSLPREVKDNRATPAAR